MTWTDISVGSVLAWAYHHWLFCLLIWIAFNVVNCMPSPNGKGVSGTLWYRWIFSSLHAIVGCVPRILATVFPSVWAMFTNVSPTAGGVTSSTSKPQTPAP